MRPCGAPTTTSGGPCTRFLPCPYHGPDGHARGPNERGRWVEVLAGMRLERPLPWNAPHPVTGCTCREGRILEEVDLRSVIGTLQLMTVAWLPPVHDCAYVQGRRAPEREATRRAVDPTGRDGESTDERRTTIPRPGRGCQDPEGR